MPLKAPHNKIQIRLVTSYDGLLALQPEWRALNAVAPAGSIFLSPDWVIPWWQQFGAHLSPRVMAARNAVGGRLLGLVLLAVGPRRALGALPYRELVMIGKDVAESAHLDALLLPEFAPRIAPAFARHIVAGLGADVVRLEGLAAGAALTEQLRNIAGVQANWREEPCPFLPLPATMDAVLAGLQRSVRSEIRRRRRRLEEAAAISFAEAQTLEDVSAALVAFFRLNGEVKLARGQEGAFNDHRLVAMQREVATRLFTAGALRLYSLTADGQVIASAYCYRDGDRVLFYNTGYSRDWSAYAPGTLILAHAIERSIAEGAKVYDMLRGAQGYKLEWTKAIAQDVYLRLPVSSRGRAVTMLLERARMLRERFRESERAEAFYQRVRERSSGVIRG